MANHASSDQFSTPTSRDEVHEISPPPPCPMALVRACLGPPSELSTWFSDAPADKSPEVLAVAAGVSLFLALAEHDLCLFGGIMMPDDASFTTKITVHSGATALARFCCVALLDTGSARTFIRRDILDSMLSGGGASIACERKCAPRSWSGLGESAPPQTLTSVRLSVHLFRADEPTCPLAVWACMEPPSVIQHAVLLGRDSSMRLYNRFYPSPPLRPSDHRIFGELELTHHAPAGMRAYAICAIDPDASGKGFSTMAP